MENHPVKDLNKKDFFDIILYKKKTKQTFSTYINKNILSLLYTNISQIYMMMILARC